MIRKQAGQGVRHGILDIKTQTPGGHINGVVYGEWAFVLGLLFIKIYR